MSLCASELGHMNRDTRPLVKENSTTAISRAALKFSFVRLCKTMLHKNANKIRIRQMYLIDLFYMYCKMNVLTTITITAIWLRTLNLRRVNTLNTLNELATNFTQKCVFNNVINYICVVKLQFVVKPNYLSRPLNRLSNV